MSSASKMLVQVYRGPTLRREVTRGDAVRELEEKLAMQGSRLLSVNWKKNIAHYIDSRGNKKTRLLFVERKHEPENLQSPVH